MPGATTSGLARGAHAAFKGAPRDDNVQTRPDRASLPPTPITSTASPGEFNVPHAGPSFPIADTTATPDATTSRTLSPNGLSAKSGPPTERLRTSTSPLQRT